MEGHIEEVELDPRCRIAASRIAAGIGQLRQPFRGNMISWLEDHLAEPIADVNEDLASYFNSLVPGMRESTITSLERVLEVAVRYFGVP